MEHNHLVPQARYNKKYQFNAINMCFVEIFLSSKIKFVVSRVEVLDKNNPFEASD